nr:hypothetical protein [Candidatus Njordarchaeota archaeon]
MRDWLFEQDQRKRSSTSIGGGLLQARIDGFSEECLTPKTDYEQLFNFKPKGESSTSLLPYDDPYNNGHRIRHRLIDKEQEKLVYAGGGGATTIPLNGKIIGMRSQNIELANPVFVT